MSPEPRENSSLSFSIVEIPMEMEWKIRYEEEERAYVDEGGYEDLYLSYSHWFAKEYVCELHR